MRHIKGILTLIKALLVANKAHEGQVRRYTKEPYITHPIAVARILHKHIGWDYNLLSAAILHDTVEDTQLTSKYIYKHFGKDIGKLVEEVTNVSKLEDGNRKLRKALDREHLANASERAKTLKLADILHNTPSIMEYEKAFSKIYLLEIELLLNVLSNSNKTLWWTVYQIVTKHKKKD